MRSGLRVVLSLSRRVQGRLTTWKAKHLCSAGLLRAPRMVCFPSFRKIKMSNIREYEERQPKLAQEESPAQLRFDNQIAPLMHQ